MAAAGRSSLMAHRTTAADTWLELACLRTTGRRCSASAVLRTTTAAAAAAADTLMLVSAAYSRIAIGNRRHRRKTVDT